MLFRAVERAIPDIKDRLEFKIIGSPLAHEAFLRRDRGTYGMAWAAGTSAPHAGLLGGVLPFPFPNLKTPVDGLLRCGDSCFPGMFKSSFFVFFKSMLPDIIALYKYAHPLSAHPLFRLKQHHINLGIGTPSAAASGAIAANTMTTIDKHIEMLEEIGKKDPMYKFMDPGFLANLYRPIVGPMTPSSELRVDQTASVAAQPL